MADEKKRTFAEIMASRPPSKVKPLTNPNATMNGEPPRKRYDVSTIGSWQEAQELYDAGTITQTEWEDFVDMACGQHSD